MILAAFGVFLLAYYALSSFHASQGTPMLATSNTTSLEQDGYQVFQTTAADTNTDTLQTALQSLPPGYELLDYTYTIRGTSLTTWHRDVTSGQRYHGARYPTYTAIQYWSMGPTLSVVPGSHRTWPFAFGEARTLVTMEPGTLVLFNADLLHAGAPNPVGAARHAVQYKIVHREDRATGCFHHLEGVRTTKTGDAEPSPQMRWLSWVFAWVSSTVGESFQQRYVGDSSWMGAIQNLFPRFYNNL